MAGIYKAFRWIFRENQKQNCGCVCDFPKIMPIKLEEIQRKMCL